VASKLVALKIVLSFFIFYDFMDVSGQKLKTNV